MKKIEIWSDFACPFCYIGEKRLKDAIRDLGKEKEIELEYRAFELDRNAPRETSESTSERIAKKYGISLDEAKRRVAEIDKAGNESGLMFRYASARPSNTLDAHRLMKFAEDKYGKKVASALNNQLFEAYFTDCRRLSDHEVLMQSAINAGMPTEETSRVLNSKHYTEQVRHDENEAEKLGVRGVPFMVFDRQFAVPGALSVEDFKSALREMLGIKHEDINDLKGSECDKTGCKVK